MGFVLMGVLAAGWEPAGVRLGNGSICGVLLVLNIHSHCIRPAAFSWLFRGVDCLIAASRAASLGGGVKSLLVTQRINRV